MCAPSAPDPVATASAQTGQNIGTAVANQYLNQTNQVTPYGNLNYTQTGTSGWTDPISGRQYDIPTFTATTSYTPEGQAILDQTMGAQLNTATAANTASQGLANTLSTQFDTSGAPAAATAPQLQSQLNLTGAGAAPQLQTSLGDAGGITASYGTDYAAQRQEVQDALMSRMQPSLTQDRNALEARLASQGISIGSAAYQAAMDDYSRQTNDARMSAVINAGTEQSRLAGLAQDQAAFQNAAQAQQFGQNQASASFGNSALQQAYANQLTGATFDNQNAQNSANFANQAAQTQYGLSQDARNQYLNEAYAGRNQGINEFSALMNGSQVQSPQFTNTPTSSIATTDYAGLVNSNYEQQMAQYNSLWGGIMGMGAGILGGI